MAVVPIAPRISRKTPGRLLPHKLGPYELFDHIGKGGMADIYRARRSNDLGVVRQVVVKEVLPELRGEERLGDLLIAEAKLAARLTHANIVRVEQLGRDEGTLYIAMEHVEGLDLRELLRRCAKSGVRIPIDVSLHVCLQVLRALDYAHRFRFDDRGAVGIIHRDVSPSNVLLSFDGEVKLCDFGIARAHGDPGDASMVRAAEGKAGYMSPEQARGEDLDGRADVFALGIILHELLTGKKLYRASAGESLLEVALRAEIPEIDARELPMGEEIRRIVGRALAFDRDARYASAAEMLVDLDRYVARAELVTSSLRLGDWLCKNFEVEILRAARGRELAVEALGRGPAARIAVIEAPAAPVVAETTEPRAAKPTRLKLKSSKKRKARRMAIDSRKIDEPPKSLEGTTADVAIERAEKSSRTSYFVLIALLAMAAIGVTFFLTRGR